MSSFQDLRFSAGTAADFIKAAERLLVGLILASVLTGLGTGCVSKSKANAQARAAFLAGQQQAMQQALTRGPTVTFVGDVKNPLIPWTAGLTLAQGLLAAEYFGSGDPRAITIVRDNQAIPVEPARLLNGEDIPLQPRDIVEIVR